MKTFDKLRKTEHMRLTKEERELIEGLRDIQRKFIEEYNIVRNDEFVKNNPVLTYKSMFSHPNYQFPNKEKVIDNYIKAIKSLVNDELPENFERALRYFFKSML